MKNIFLINIYKIVSEKTLASKLKPICGLTVLPLFFILSCVHQPTEVERNPSSQHNSVEYFKFEQCSNNKMYLNEKMKSMPDEYFQLHESDQLNRIPIKCIQFAQKNFSGNYAICSGEETKPLISNVKHCLNENYVMLTYNSYHDVMDCFNLNPRDFYLQIMIESGFHINAINKTGFDSGITQFTANGIKKVSANNLIERTRRLLLESSRPSCQRISSIVGEFNTDAFSVQKRCAIISLPKNPYRAMLFNYLHTMLDQILLEEILSDMPAIETALTPKIKRQLTYMSYNRGLTGVKRLVKGYINSRNYFEQTITEEMLDLNQNLSAVKKILKLEPEKRDILKKSNVRNLSFAEYAVIHGASYLSDMSAANDYVQQNLGNSCGEF